MECVRQVITRHLPRGLTTAATWGDCGLPTVLSSSCRVTPGFLGVAANVPTATVMPARRTVTTSTASTTPLAAATKRETFRPVLEVPRAAEGWVRPVDNTQMMFIEGHRQGTRQSSPYFILNSAAPLNTEDIQRALVHLYRKTPMYQLSLREREGRLWWYRPRSFELDFKVMEDITDKSKIVEQLLKEEFNEEGPLWKARLFPATEDDVCPLPEVQARLPYKSIFSLLGHHGVADGPTYSYLCQKFLDLLNDVIDNRPIDDEIPFGEFVSNEEIVKQDALIREELMKDPERLEMLKAHTLKFNKSPTLLKAFPRPQNVEPATKHIVLEIQEDLLQNFFKNCKNAGVTFGTAFQALINTAMVEMVRDAGVEDESHDISINLAMNLRRYMKPYPPLAFGLHIRTMASLMNTPKNVREHFWEYSNNFQHMVKTNLKSRFVLEQEVVRQMVMPKVSPKDYYKGPIEVTRDYGFSNMTELHTILTGNGKHVQMTNTLQFTNVHKFLYAQLHQVFSFRGSCKYTISYATDYTSDDTANILAGRVLALMRNFSR